MINFPKATHDGVTDGGDPWWWHLLDASGRDLATFRGSDSDAKEMHVYHEAPGWSHLAFLRDVDGDTNWRDAGDGRCETRAYLVQNARGDTIGVFGPAGMTVERAEFSPTGSPLRLHISDGWQIGGAPGADGFLTGDDAVAFTNEWALSTKTFRTDLNNDNTLNVTDFNAWNDAFYDGSAVGRGVLSKADGTDAAGPGNSRGWAGRTLDVQVSGPAVSPTSGQTGRDFYLSRTMSLAGQDDEATMALIPYSDPAGPPNTLPAPWDPGVPWVGCISSATSFSTCIQCCNGSLSQPTRWQCRKMCMKLWNMRIGPCIDGSDGYPIGPPRCSGWIPSGLPIETAYPYDPVPAPFNCMGPCQARVCTDQRLVNTCNQRRICPDGTVYEAEPTQAFKVMSTCGIASGTFSWVPGTGSCQCCVNTSNTLGLCTVFPRKWLPIAPGPPNPPSQSYPQAPSISPVYR